MAAPVMIGASRLGVGPQNVGQTIAPVPLYQPSTDYGVLGANSGSYGNTPNSSGTEYTDPYGTKFRLVDYGNGKAEWLQVLPDGSLARPQDVGAIEQRSTFQPTPGANIQGTRSAGNVGATPGNNFFTPAGSQRPVQMAGTSSMGVAPGGTSIAPQGSTTPNYQQMYNDLLNDYTQNQNNWFTGQSQRDTDYLNTMGGIVNGANTADLAALGNYHTAVDPLIGQIQGIQAPTWTDFVSDPADVQRQMDAYNWASGAANGSLDYQAALANYQTANYQTANYQTYQAQLADYQRAQLFQAALERYASNPQDIQAQKDAIAYLKGDIEHGGDEQREAMNRYKALTSPEITAQERYLAEIARRSFESQDRSNREAVLQDLSMRGLRSGGAEIASALANQERLGQDRTLAELGLQANAVGRSMQALQGYSQSASNLRAADLQAMGLYVDATGQLRSMNDAVGMFNTNQANTVNMFNANAANQNSQFNANAYNQNQMFNAEQNNIASRFNADAYNQNQQFNANAYNMNQQFNANAYNQNQIANAGFQNQAMANNQQARVAGGVAMTNTANSIRQQNDAIGMFNKNGSQTSQIFAADLAFRKADATGRIAQNTFANDTGVNDTNAARSASLAGLNWSVPSQTAATQKSGNDILTQMRGLQLAGMADPQPSRSFTIPGLGV